MAVMFVLLLACFWTLVLKSTHLLSFLIGLEFLGLMVFISFISIQLQLVGSVILVFFFLASLGCESVLGLVLFVILTRANSKDYLLQLSLLKF